MYFKRSIIFIKNFLYLITMLVLLFALMVLFRNYSAQLPFKMILVTFIIQYVLFQILGRIVSVSFDDTSNDIVFDNKEAVLKFYVNKRSIYPFQRADVYVRYKNSFCDNWKKKKIVLELGDGIRQHKNERINLAAWGYTELEIENVLLYDMFGMSSVRIKRINVRKSSVIVFPKVEDIVVDTLDIKTVASDFEEYMELSGYGSGDNGQYEIREFKEGDIINRIHWKLSSKQDEYMVRDELTDNEEMIYLFFRMDRREDIDKILKETISLGYGLLNAGCVFYALWIEYDAEYAGYRLLREKVTCDEKYIDIIIRIMRDGVYENMGFTERIIKLLTDSDNKVLKVFSIIK